MFKTDGVVVLFKPNIDKLNRNISTYLDGLNKLFIIDNTPNADLSKTFKDKRIKYIPLKDNKGIAYALNIGAKESINDGADWILTMDQDSSFIGDGFYELKKFVEKFSKDEYIGKICDTKFESIGIVSALQVIEQNAGDYLIGVTKPDVVMASGNLVNAKAYKKIKGFNEDMFIDCVDFDFCLNMRKHGYQILQLNFVRLKHYLGNTVKKRFLGLTMYADNHSSMRKYYEVRNRHYLYDMYHDEFPYYCKLELGRTKKELLKIWLFEKDKMKKTRAMYIGYSDYKKGKVGKGPF